MSSTTSSDCESCDCSQCTYSFENNHNDYGKLLLNSRHVPMYATMAHPLVYYAEIQPATACAGNKRQISDRPRKDNPFKKAFKWYTQERNGSNKSDAAPEKSEFANWLDNKYVEYLRESGQQSKAPSSPQAQASKTSIAGPFPPCCCPESTKKKGRKKKGGKKSPKRQRKRPGNDSGDVSEKCTNPSCKFLLKPKELTRAASEPSFHSPTSGCKSNTTVRSHSLSDVAREKSASVQKFPNCQPTKLPTKSPSKEDLTNNEGPCCNSKCLVSSKEQLPTNKEGPCCNCKCLQEKVSEVVQVPSQSRAVDASCQCPEEQVVPVHEETQYAPEPERSTQNLGPCCCKTCNKPIPPPPPILCLPVKVQSNKIPTPEMCRKAIQICSMSCQSCGSKSKVDTQCQHQPELPVCCKATAARPNNSHEVNQVFGPIPIQRQSCSTVGINEETGECYIVKEVAVMKKCTRCVTCASNDAAQTSDHSIRLEKPPCCCQYPVFLKIICDK